MQMKLFLGIVIINTILVALYFVWKICDKKSNRRSMVICGLVMLFCPVVGISFFLLSAVCLRIFFSKPVDLADVIFSKERKKMFVHADEERERNIVPLEEAIEVTEKEELRSLMMNVVRGDIQKSLAAISLALNSEDTEVAHYAASVLQTELNKFRIYVEKQYTMILAGGKEMLSCANALVEYMNQVLEQKVFSEMEQRRYTLLMDEVCELMYTNNSAYLTSNHYEAISIRLLEMEEYDLCKKWCERAEYHFPNTLSTYSSQLKLYFNKGDKKRFFEVLEQLKKSPVVIDSETLELIRVFS